MAKNAVPPEVLAILAAGSKIEAIKRLRDLAGLGLKEAKDRIDAHEHGGAPPPQSQSKGGFAAAHTGVRKPGQPHLGPGEVAPRSGSGTWLALLMVAAVAIGAAIFFR